MSNPLRDFESQIFHRVNPAVKFSVTRYVLAIGIFVAIVAFGAVSALGLGVDLLPSVVIPSVNVGTSYPGATPAVVDQQITQVIENAVSTLSGITDMNSQSSPGQSRVTLSFSPNSDPGQMTNQVASIVNATTRRLPNGVQPPVVRTFDPNSQPIIQFGVTGGGASLAQVADYVNNSLSPVLERVDGVANINLDGAPARQFLVLLDPNKLRFFNLAPNQVVTAITSAAVNQPIGTITTQGNSLTFSTQNVPEGLDQIRRVLVDSNRGVAVADIAVVRDASVESNYARVNGVPSILVSVQRTTNSNSVAVVDRVRKALAGLTLPKDYGITISEDTTGPIRASIDSTWKELFTTLIVVAIIVLLFLGKPNTAFSVILAIPIALSASPILYNLAGFSFNLVSLLALVIAIGVVVDDSIVVAENVERYRKMGFPLKEAVLKGASEVFSAVVAASLSLLSVLLPVSFMGGFVGRYLMQFSLGLAAAVAFSLLEAVLFLTVRLAYTPEGKDIGWKEAFGSLTRVAGAFKWGLKAFRSGFGILAAVAIAAALFATKHLPWIAALLAWPLALGVFNYFLTIALYFLEALTATLHGWTEWAVSKIRDGYTKLLGRMLKRSAWVLAGVGSVLIITAVFMVPKIPFNFVPNSDGGVLSVNVRFPPGTPKETANKAAAIVEDFVSQRPEVVTYQATVGGGASIDAILTPVGKRRNIVDLAQDWRKIAQPLIVKQFPAARVSVSSGGGGPGGFGGGGSSLQLAIVAPDFDTLSKSNAAILAAIQQNQWVADATSSLSDTNIENDFVPNPAALKGTGLTPANIATTLQVYTTGSQASNVVTGGLAYPITVKIDPTSLAGQQTLLDLPVYSTSQQTSYQIGQLGSFNLTQSPTSLSRYNRQYQGSLNINLKPGAPTALELQNEIIADLSSRGLLDNGVAVSANSRFGQAALAGQLASTGPQLFLLALFLAYLVMAAQFNSWRYPIYLLLPVPLALIGALIFIFFAGGGIDIFGLMGMLMLIGLSAKNAILYLDFVVERLGKMPFESALTEAARLRFRPIVMTTLTVLVISFPLMLSTGQGSEFGQRMGIVMLGGIVFSAILTFFVVPAAFWLFERKRQTGFDSNKLEIEKACEDVETGTLPPGLGEVEPGIVASTVSLETGGASKPVVRSIKEAGDKVESVEM
jgi:HAE1 family hydrophobic/amphiphilic exporter-1